MTLNTANRIAVVLQLFIDSFSTIGTFVIHIDEQTPGRVMDSVITLWYGGERRSMLSIDRSDARGVWYSLRDSIRYWARYDRKVHASSYAARERMGRKTDNVKWEEIEIGKGFSSQGVIYIKVSEIDAYNTEDQRCINRGSITRGVEKFRRPINRYALRHNPPQAVKRAMFRADAYAMEVPPVPHAQWLEDNWIAWIDRSGYWIVQN